MNPSISSTYTLLIVESPVIARLITSYQIPWLEVIATEGYCWMPEWDTKKQTYRFRANTAKREIRKRIKEQSRWASRVIIAADTDPSGDFIAASVQHYLKDKQCLRACLTHLGKSSILELITDANLNVASTGYDRLIKNRIQLQELQKAYGSVIQNTRLLPVILSLARYYQHKPVIIECQNKFGPAINIASTIVPSFPLPLNTMDILVNDIFPENMSFADRQNTLNELFMFHHEEIPPGLISYPRTAATGYYSDTWASLLRRISNHDMSATIPAPLQLTIQDEEAHESIHIHNPDITPHSVRPYMPALHYNLYSMIFSHTQETLAAPEWIFDFAAREFSNSDVEPLMTLSELARFWSQDGSVSPSSYGKVLDKLIHEEWLFLTDKNQWEPAPKLLSFIENPPE